ncbi:MAG: hypothetical protein Hyperionvirus3_155 [Hyperionvirus sp.]|uniref:Uncharacterized protein n=1 Tax=Hyperionvirus sp. TaxID=2487770 RepID=A0A3G5ACE2_9VIRU|nr:MAG: hypothetical protein Hyperionvirus3_155 [Hyperionvirus sp.]
MKYGLSFHNTDATIAIENRIKKYSSNINGYLAAKGIPLKYRNNDIYRASLVMTSR